MKYILILLLLVGAISCSTHARKKVMLDDGKIVTIVLSDDVNDIVRSLNVKDIVVRNTTFGYSFYGLYKDTIPAPIVNDSIVITYHRGFIF